MGTDYLALLQKISSAVGIVMGLLEQGPAAYTLAVKILETIQTDPNKLDMDKIHQEMQALEPMPMREE